MSIPGANRIFLPLAKQLYCCGFTLRKEVRLLRKTVAMALVLIIGAAVVLWYGNTLNSWVVGGLIGGFAALLLSIPISLVLFSYFSRHYDVHQQRGVLVHRGLSLAQTSSYSIVLDEDNEESIDEEQEFEYDNGEVYDGELDTDGDEYILVERSVWEERQSRQLPPARHVSSPATARLPIVNQDLLLEVERGHVDGNPEQRSGQREKSEARPVKYSGSAGNRKDPSYSRYRSQALRAARAEAALRAEYEEDNVFLSTRTMRHLRQKQRGDGRWPFSRGIPEPPTNNYSQRPQRIVDSLPPQNGSPRPLPALDNASQIDRFTSYRDAQTGYEIDEAAKANSCRSLIRRTPYLYEDDCLREEMAEYVKRPMVRRSSRYLKPSSADDEQ
jgi:hypothetical protein